MHVLVTGGAGFIGSHVVHRLLPVVSAVTVLDDMSTGSSSNLNECDVHLIEGSILDHDALARATERSDVIVHLAALGSVPRSFDNPAATHAANATGTLRVLEVARTRGQHVVLASSSSVYGSGHPLPLTESMAPRPLSPYGASKLAAESYALSYAAGFDLPVLALRFFSVYGPRQSVGHPYAAVIPTFIHAALQEQPLPLQGDGTQTRDFTFVGDVADLVVESVRRTVTHPGPVNLAAGSRHSLLDIIAILEHHIGRPLAIYHLPKRNGDVPSSQADTGVLRSLFTTPCTTPVDVGVAATVNWMRESTR